MRKLSFKAFKDFFDKHESTLSSVTLVLGFIVDYFTLKRVDYLFDNLIIITYLLVAGVSILIINFYEAGKFHNRLTSTIYEFLPFALQFSFGGLFSAFTIFYSKSTSFIASGLFVVMLFSMMVGNEFFKKRYSKLVFQVGIYFLAIFSFFIYFLPVIFKRMGINVFLWSGSVSLIFISLFIFLIGYFAPLKRKENSRILFFTIFGIWAVMNLLYIFNIIPPIPLSLKTGNIYHLVEKKTEGGYLVVKEKENKWYEKWNPNKKIHLKSGESAYVFSSVFAPADLNIKIVHDWQYYNEEKNKWISLNKINFPMTGGREKGYRGFSKKANVFSGKWRVDVKTERGQVIGRVRFNIEISDFERELEIKSI